jgi:hypothetical protein|tara:strand:- start:2102 stop:2485 length:384 start_codon:yes stop_codon:yes gene_type:complete
MPKGQLQKSLNRTKGKESQLTPYERLEAPFNQIADRLQKNDIKIYGKVRDDTFNRLIKKIRESDAMVKQGKKVTDPIVLKMMKVYKSDKNRKNIFNPVSKEQQDKQNKSLNRGFKKDNIFYMKPKDK